MTHVSLRAIDGRAAITVDGVDISNHVLREGFCIEPGPGDSFLVHLVVMADSVEADLPDAVITATTSGGAS